MLHHATRTTAALPRLPEGFQPAADCSRAVANSLMLAQEAQWEAMFCWQRSLATIGEEMFDEWACRWAGGVPIE